MKEQMEQPLFEYRVCNIFADPKGGQAAQPTDRYFDRFCDAIDAIDSEGDEEAVITVASAYIRDPDPPGVVWFLDAKSQDNFLYHLEFWLPQVVEQIARWYEDGVHTADIVSLLMRAGAVRVSHDDPTGARHIADRF